MFAVPLDKLALFKKMVATPTKTAAAPAQAATAAPAKAPGARVSPEQEKLIKKQFAAARTRLGAEKASLQDQYKDQMARQSAILGGGGGAVLKSQRKGLEDISRAFGEAQTGLEGQEAGVLQAAQDTAEARAQQERQFGKTLEFQKGSFADTMQFQWAEMQENQKTNFINAYMAMKDSGLLGGDESKDLFSSGLLAKLFPSYITKGSSPAWTQRDQFGTIPFYGSGGGEAPVPSKYRV